MDINMKLNKESVRSRQEVIQNELIWHEEEAHRRIPIDQFLYAPPAFESIIDEGIAFLDATPEKWLLEVGCGEGKESVKFYAQNLKAVSIDLSLVQLQRARELMEEKFGDAQTFFVQANAEELPFAADSFQAIYAKAILHHLDVDIAYAQIERTLAPNGRVAITEPLAHHPMIQFGRFVTPGLRTRDERPIPFHEFKQFAARFPQSKVTVYFLIAPASYLFRILPRGEKLFRKTHKFLQRIDAWLFDAVPFLRRLAWYSSIKAKI